MNTHTEDQEIDCNSAYNPFPEPQTIPAGWDLSALTSRPEVNLTDDEDNEADT